MNIAFISTKPATLESGTEVRNFYLLKALQKNFKVNYITPKLPRLLPEQNFIKRFLYLLSGKIPYIEYNREGKLSSKDLEKISKSDIVQIQELESFFVIEKYLSNIKGIIVLDAHNVEYQRFLSGTETEGFFIKWLGRFLSQKVKQIEINAFNKIDYILACSEVDKKYFSQYLSEDKIVLIPNGVNKNQQIKNTLQKKNTILFMGQLSYGPNSDGIRYYLDKIHPIIKEKMKDIEIIVIGKNAPQWLINKASKDKSIVLKGFVESINTELNKVSVCICPLRYGSGTRLKVLEYMSAGKAVVSTTKGAEGIGIRNGENICIADTPDDFANNVMALLSNPIVANDIGKKAQVFIQQNYDWEKITEQLTRFYSKVLKK